MAPYFSFAPDKRCGVLVVRGSERVDGGDEVLGALEARVVERFSLEDAKPDLNLVEPAGAGGREVKGDVRMRGEPVQIGRAPCRERVCQYVEISVVAVALKKKTRIRN